MLKPLLLCHARSLLAAALALAGSASSAQEQQPQRCGKAWGAERFTAFHDNYALWNQMSNNGWAPRDERALRGQVSVKYSLVNCPQRRDERTRALKPAPAAADAADSAGAVQPLETEKEKQEKPLTFWQRLHSAEVFVSYTNRFDFYVGSRDSGPVINRVNNPGLHLRLPGRLFTGDAGDTRGAWQLSFEHMSDGQVVEPVSNAADRLRAQRAYERGERHFFDTISRGMNYVAVQGEWVWDLPRKDAVFDVRAKIKAYASSDSAITWGPLADQGLKFRHYERVKVRLGLFWPHWGRFELTSQLGDSGLKHSSHTLSWQYDVGAEGSGRLRLPLFVQAHFGPMNTLSNYTQRQDSIGIGLRLAY
jgi:hypothetical protein